MNAIHWPGAEGLEQVPFRRLFKAIRREVPENAAIVTAYTDGQVTLRANRSKIGYHEAANLDGYQGVEPGDFVVHGLDIMRGSVGVSDSRGAISSVCTICTPLRELDLRYVAYVIREQAFSGFPKALARGVREGGADFRRWDTLAELPIPAIDDGMQRVIADYLDRETAEIDAFVAESEKLITLLNERRAAVIESCFFELDEFVQIRRLRPIVESGVSVNGESEPADADEIGVLKTGAVSRGYFRPGENKRVIDTELDRVACPVRQGTLIVNRANTPELVGQAGYVSQDWPNLYLSDKLWQLQFPDTDAAYVHYWIQTEHYRGQVRATVVGASSSMQNLSYLDFLAMRIPMTTKASQRAIVTYLDEQTAKIDEAIATAREAIALAKERRQALISAAVTGKIDVRTAA